MKIKSNIDKQTPFTASVLLTGANLFSKPLAFLRELLFAYSFGISHITDFFFFTFNLSNSLIWSILKTYSCSFMPVFLDIKSKDHDSAIEFLANSFLWIIIQSLILFLLTSIIIFVWQSEDKLIGTKLAITIVILNVSYSTLAGIGQFLTVICQSYYQFFYPVLFAFLFNVFTVGALLFFTKSFGIEAFIFSQVIWAFYK
jgi:putative peptidoglycan lipid II flippase